MPAIWSLMSHIPHLLWSAIVNFSDKKVLPAPRFTVTKPIVCRKWGSRHNVCQVQRRLGTIRELGQTLHGSTSTTVPLGHASHGAP